MQEENENKFDDLVSKATINIKDILDMSIKRNQPSFAKASKDKNESMLVIYDEQSGLAKILKEAYRSAIPSLALPEKKSEILGVKFLNFDNSNKEEIMSEIEKLKVNDLVVMIQTTNFRLDDFRIRLHLFSKKLKVIEHMHLNRNEEGVWDVYIDSLKYDKEYYHKYGHGIKKILGSAKKFTIKSGNTELVVDGEMEDAMLNIGDYEGMNNVGGTFPIGEVFTESKILENVSGEIYIYAFADENFVIRMYEPFKINIEAGLVVGYGDNTPQEFVKILEEVRSFEKPYIREIGFGLNKAITKERPLGDITAFERIYGMHLSLGEKHSMYKKQSMTTKKTKYHVDLFPVVDEVICTEKITHKEIILYKDGEYVI